MFLSELKVPDLNAREIGITEGLLKKIKNFFLDRV